MSNVNIDVNIKSGRILVTGGNGFVGSHVIDYLKERGYEVTVLDRFDTPHRDDVDFELGDIRDRSIIDKLAKNHDGIINFAAILGTSETVSNPIATVDSNIMGALNIYDAVRENKIPATHITVGNYWMKNPYAITKYAAERIAMYYNQKYNTKISIVRGLNAYGERQKAKPVRKIIPNFVIPAIRNEEILIFGDGNQKMDMVYVKDLARVLVRALVLDHKNWDGIFEAGTGVGPTVNEIAEIVVRQAKSNCRVTHVPMRQGEPEKSVVIGNPETLAPLGIKPADLLPFNEGIKPTIEYYRKHEPEF